MPQSPVPVWKREEGTGLQARAPSQEHSGVGRAKQGWHTRQTFFCMAKAGRPQTPEVTANPKNRQQAPLALKVTALSHSMLTMAQGTGVSGPEGICLWPHAQGPRTRQAPASSGSPASASRSSTQAGPFGTVTLSALLLQTGCIRNDHQGGRDQAGAPVTLQRDFNCTY